MCIEEKNVRNIRLKNQKISPLKGTQTRVTCQLQTVHPPFLFYPRGEVSFGVLSVPYLAYENNTQGQPSQGSKCHLPRAQRQYKRARTSLIHTG